MMEGQHVAEFVMLVLSCKPLLIPLRPVYGSPTGISHLGPNQYLSCTFLKSLGQEL